MGNIYHCNTFTSICCKDEKPETLGLPPAFDVLFCINDRNRIHPQLVVNHYVCKMPETYLIKVHDPDMRPSPELLLFFLFFYIFIVYL